MIDKKQIIEETLKNLGILSYEQIEQALKVQSENKGYFSDVLVKLGYISSPKLGQSLIAQFGLIPVSLSGLEIPNELLTQIPAETVSLHHIIPLEKKDSVIKAATDDPLNFLAVDNLSKILGEKLELELISDTQLKEVFEKNYGKKDEKDIDVMVEKIEGDEISLGVGEMSKEVTKEEAPIIRLVALLMTEAVKNRSSDIHVEPLEKKLRIRYRIDGVLHEVPGPPQKLQGSIISRIKLMAGLDIAEKRLPQDGRIRVNLLGKSLDLRVSTLPGIYGESTVLRILDKASLLVDLSELGFSSNDQQKFEDIINAPNGMILVTGPTGSGKTTTLYAALNKINKPNKKLITVEDPVEYQISGINQVQVKSQIGLTFAGGLRSMLRQAPDIIFVGEIRDLETATIAIQAALTGHLIFSTLHTNDSASAVTRLVDMGIKPYLVASTVQAILAQRLVRKICPVCKKFYTPADEELAAVGLKEKDIKGVTLYKGEGCDECSHTGFKGRLAIFELLSVTDSLRDLFFDKESSTVIKNKAREQGMRTLRQDGVDKVLAGTTTFSEIIRVTQSDE